MVWMVSIPPMISCSSSFSFPLGTVPSVQSTVDITVTLMFHSFFFLSSTVPVIIYLFAFFYFHSVIHWNGKIANKFFPLLINTRYDIPDPFSPPLPIVHCFQLVFRATSRIGTELLYVGSSWSSYLCSAMWRGSQEYITYELVPTSPAVSHMSGSSNFDSFRDG